MHHARAYKISDQHTEPHAYPGANQPHQWPWILMTEEFAVKPHHTLMLVPFHEYGAGAAAHSLVMNHMRIRCK